MCRFLLFLMVFFSSTILSSNVSAQAPDTWDNYVATGFADGDGSQASPFLIATAEQLAYLAKQVNDETISNHYVGNFFKLSADIDLAGKEWVPIGETNSKAYFSGSFDGNNHVIRNLTINQQSGSRSYDYTGLFGRCREGFRLENVTIDGGAVKGGIGGYTAAIVGYIAGTTGSRSDSIIIANCVSKVTVNQTKNADYTYAGGIVGYVGNYEIIMPVGIRDCVNYGDVTGYAAVGGIVGRYYRFSGLNLDRCINYGNITGGLTKTASVRSHTAGIIGSIGSRPDHNFLTDVKIRQCINYGSINGQSTGSATGGILGYASSQGSGGDRDDSRISIEQCINNGNITDNGVNSCSGGIAGYVYIAVSSYFWYDRTGTASFDRNINTGIITSGTGTISSGGIIGCGECYGEGNGGFGRRGTGVIAINRNVNLGVIVSRSSTGYVGGIMGYGKITSGVYDGLRGSGKLISNYNHNYASILGNGGGFAGTITFADQCTSEIAASYYLQEQDINAGLNAVATLAEGINVAAIQPLSLNEFTQSSNFTDWEFAYLSTELRFPLPVYFIQKQNILTLDFANAADVYKPYDKKLDVRDIVDDLFVIKGSPSGANVGINVEKSKGIYNSAAIGTNKIVSISGLTLTGTDASNYILLGSVSGKSGRIGESTTVIFELQTSTLPNDTVIISRNTKVSQPVDPIRNKYEFGGWYSSPQYENPYNYDAPINQDTIKIYAKWLCTVTISENHKGAETTSFKVIENSLISVEDLESEGYIFDKWYTNPAYTAASLWNMETSLVKQDTTLYAKWLCEVTFFEYEGHTSTTIVSENSKITPPGGTDRELYAFQGWFKEPEYINEFIFYTDIITRTTTLYAKWLLTGIDDIEKADINIYPNPFAGNTKISGALGYVLKVVNSIGETVYSKKITSQDETISLEGLPVGLYYFCFNKNGNRITLKGSKNSI
ncbi:MAG: InlB B-repeat-containing protein [Bacteroidales bacterium]|jgi:hypothetical protein|nr:InlB B-repeat-containing protein [Bacteroidales bacterium]